MNTAEFDSKRAALVELLMLRAKQSNWRLASEVCADLLELESEWALEHPLKDTQPGSGRYQPVVDEMNAHNEPQ